LKKLIEHPRASEAQLLTTNAFALLSKHRFFLATALFLLAECYEDAAKVCVSRLKDLQLMLLVTRRQPEVATTLLEEQLSSEVTRRDPWLQLLLAWHCGRVESLANLQSSGAEEVGDPDPSALPLFDGVLRPSLDNTLLPQVLATLTPQPAKFHVSVSNLA